MAVSQTGEKQGWKKKRSPSSTIRSLNWRRASARSGWSLRITQNIERHHRIHHGRIDGAQPVGMVEALDHPFGFAFSTARRRMALRARCAPTTSGNESIAEKQCCASETACRLQRTLPACAGRPNFIQVKARGHRAARIGGMHDGERNHNGARPRRHLVEQIERQQRHFGWNARGNTRADRDRTG